MKKNEKKLQHSSQRFIPLFDCCFAKLMHEIISLWNIYQNLEPFLSTWQE